MLEIILSCWTFETRIARVSFGLAVPKVYHHKNRNRKQQSGIDKASGLWLYGFDFVAGSGRGRLKRPNYKTNQQNLQNILLAEQETCT